MTEDFIDGHCILLNTYDEIIRRSGNYVAEESRYQRGLSMSMKALHAEVSYYNLVERQEILYCTVLH